jgi:hypothetical protein
MLERIERMGGAEPYGRPIPTEIPLSAASRVALLILPALPRHCRSHPYGRPIPAEFPLSAASRVALLIIPALPRHCRPSPVRATQPHRFGCLPIGAGRPECRYGSPHPSLPPNRERACSGEGVRLTAGERAKNRPQMAAGRGDPSPPIRMPTNRSGSPGKPSWQRQLAI